MDDPSHIHLFSWFLIRGWQLRLRERRDVKMTYAIAMLCLLIEAPYRRLERYVSSRSSVRLLTKNIPIYERMLENILVRDFLRLSFILMSYHYH